LSENNKASQLASPRLLGSTLIAEATFKLQNKNKKLAININKCLTRAGYIFNFLSIPTNLSK